MTGTFENMRKFAAGEPQDQFVGEPTGPLMTYDGVSAALREHAEFKPAGGWVTYGLETECLGQSLLPRHVLADTWATQFPSLVPDHCLPDLWISGLEMVLQEHTNRKARPLYELDLIGGYLERVSFQHYRESGIVEQYIDRLEERAQTVHAVEWRESYLLGAYGLHSLRVFLLAEWPDGARLYKVDLYEGEGWWGSFFFGWRAKGGA